jgi:hypothetical protein
MRAPFENSVTRFGMVYRGGNTEKRYLRNARESPVRSGLDLIQLRVLTTLGHQLVMGADLH